MLKRNISNIIYLLAFVLVFPACTKDECTREVTYKTKEPVYKSVESIRDEVETGSSQGLTNPGKIYFRTDDYLFVGEANKGIHIFDNADPTNPQNLSYITMPGNTDFAVKEDVLFANSHIDLYTIDISNPSNPQIMNRIENTFAGETMAQDQRGRFVEGKGVIVDFKEKEVTETVDCERARNPGGVRPFDNPSAGNNSGVSQGNPQPTGIGGSMARFTIYKDYLYSVDWQDLNIFSISNPANPNEINEQELRRGIETIFSYKDQLFIGSRTGMFIYDNTDPTNPHRLSTFEHANVCDPVYPTDSFAYVTLNGGGECGQADDELNVVDIVDITSPDLLATYPMADPQGLAVQNKKLFLCDGTAGLKVYDTQDPQAITDNQLDQKPDIHAFDAIPHDQVLMVVGNNGLYQYDFTNPNNLEELSYIPVANQ